jgi:hypothetical protein
MTLGDQADAFGYEPSVISSIEMGAFAIASPLFGENHKVAAPQ